MNKDIEKIIIDILSEELEIPLVYSTGPKGNEIPAFVMGFNDANLGKIKDLQIAVTVLNNKIMSSKSEVNFTVDPAIETQTVRSQASVQIDLISQNRDAATRNWEIVAALTSIYSVQQQEKYQFKIFKVPNSFTNTSAAEGSSNLNRYTIVISAFLWHNKSKELDDFYSYFNTRVDNSKTIGEDEGMIEFEEGSPLAP